MFLGLLDPGPDPLVISTGPDPDLAPVPDPHPSIIKHHQDRFLLHIIVKISKFFLPANLSRTVLTVLYLYVLKIYWYFIIFYLAESKVGSGRHITH